VFERYAIVSQSDIHDAMAKLEAGQQREKAKRRARAESCEKAIWAGFGQN